MGIGRRVGRRKARRYMNEMDIHPIYPKMNLSKRMQTRISVSDCSDRLVQPLYRRMGSR